MLDGGAVLLAGLLGALIAMLVLCASQTRRAGGRYPSLCAYILLMLSIFCGVALLFAVLRPYSG